MGKVTGFRRIEQSCRGIVQAARRRPKLLIWLAAAAWITSGTHIFACTLPPEQPADSQLRNASADSVAAKAIVTNFVPLGPITGVPHAGFRLELRVLEVFKGAPGPTMIVTYGSCHPPVEIGQTINVIAQVLPTGEIVSR